VWCGLVQCGAALKQRNVAPSCRLSKMDNLTRTVKSGGGMWHSIFNPSYYLYLFFPHGMCSLSQVRWQLAEIKHTGNGLLQVPLNGGNTVGVGIDVGVDVAVDADVNVGVGVAN
jgi:hypothetical protein